ncbi:hypothetical protein Tco_0132483 [Tanacetum coccineum]
MCIYLKNMEGKKLEDLKNKSFDSIQKMFDRAFKRVNTFVDFRTDLVKGSSKRAGEELEQEKEVAIDVVPLATKPPTTLAAKASKHFIAIKNFDREDLETLWKLVKAKHRSTRPEEGYESAISYMTPVEFISVSLEDKAHLTGEVASDDLRDALSVIFGLSELKVASDDLRDALSAIFGLSELKVSS